MLPEARWVPHRLSKKIPRVPSSRQRWGTRGCVVFLLCSQWRPVPLGTSAGVPAGRGQQRGPPTPRGPGPHADGHGHRVTASLPEPAGRLSSDQPRNAPGQRQTTLCNDQHICPAPLLTEHLPASFLTDRLKTPRERGLREMRSLARGFSDGKGWGRACAHLLPPTPHRPHPRPEGDGRRSPAGSSY